MRPLCSSIEVGAHATVPLDAIDTHPEWGLSSFVVTSIIFELSIDACLSCVLLTGNGPH
jgi:hypothetical protein